MRKYLVGVIALLALTFTSLGLAAGSPKIADSDLSGAASAGTATASGQCSKAEAIDAVRRLGLSDVSPTYPVWKVLCGAFAGAGSQTMVALISGFDNVGMLYWAVFSWSGSEWQFLMKQRQAAVLTAAGSDIRETVSIYRPDDPRCCPSGGTRTRIWHWNGARFVAGPWQLATAENAGQRPTRFESPSRNIECSMYDGSSGEFSRDVVCSSDSPPQFVILTADGHLKIRRIQKGCGCDEPNAARLAYGRQITVGRFRCLSLEIGITCTVIRSGKGFLINRDGVSRVGP